MNEGEVAITSGFKLPAKYIIHAVSPRYIDGNSGEENKLREAAEAEARRRDEEEARRREAEAKTKAEQERPNREDIDPFFPNKK